MPRLIACLRPYLLRAEKLIVPSVERGGMKSKPYSSLRMRPMSPVRYGMGASPDNIRFPMVKRPFSLAPAMIMDVTPLWLNVSTMPLV